MLLRISEGCRRKPNGKTTRGGKEKEEEEETTKEDTQ
jgi:hypothetical protein